MKTAPEHSVGDSYFEALFDGNDDPWAFRHRWYEQRKRDLTLAVLPRQRYASVFEPGCANGELGAALAERCDRLLCADTSARAVALAQARLKPFAHAEVRQQRLPEQWPQARFDLIVISEMAYYLSPEDLDRLIARIRDSLEDDGQVLACHWRPAIEGAPLTAEAVHSRFAACLDMTRLVTHDEPDFLLDLWSRDPRSLAEQEQLR